MNKYFLLVLNLIIFLLLVTSPVFAFWVWTPETNKWVNPKYAVKDTPAEQLQFSLEFYEAKDYEEALKELKKLLRHYPKAKEAPEAQYYIALCSEEQSKLYDAFKNYQEVIDKYPFSERAPEIIKKQYDLGLKMLETQDQRSGFMQTFAGDQYDVVDVFKTVIKNAPYGPFAPQAQYKIGLYLLEKGLYQESRDEFEKLMNDYPESDWVKAAKYQIAVADAKRSTNAQYDQKVTQSAVEEFKDFLKTYPDAELSEQAKEQIHQLREKEAENNFVVAEFYEKQKNYKAARIYYQGVVDDYRNTPWATKALEKIQALSGKE